MCHDTPVTNTVCVRIREDASVEDVPSLSRGDRLPWRITQGTKQKDVDKLALEVAERLSVKDLYPAGEERPIARLEPDSLGRQVHLHSIVGMQWSRGVLLQVCSPELRRLGHVGGVNTAAEKLIDWNRTRDPRHRPENVQGVLLLVAYTRHGDGGMPCHEYGAVSRESLQTLQRKFPWLHFDESLLAWMNPPSLPKLPSFACSGSPPMIMPQGPPPQTLEGGWAPTIKAKPHGGARGPAAAIQQLAKPAPTIIAKPAPTIKATPPYPETVEVLPLSSSRPDEPKPDVPACETQEGEAGKVRVVPVKAAPGKLPPKQPPPTCQSPPPLHDSWAELDRWGDATSDKGTGVSGPVWSPTGKEHRSANSLSCGLVWTGKSANPANSATQHTTVYKSKGMDEGPATAAKINTLLSKCDELEPHREFLQKRHFRSHYIGAHFFVRPQHFLDVAESLHQKLQGDIIVSDCWQAAVEGVLGVLTASGIDFFPKVPAAPFVDAFGQAGEVFYKLTIMVTDMDRGEAGTVDEVNTLLSTCDELEPHREFLQNRNFKSYYLGAHFFVLPQHFLEVTQNLYQELRPGDIIVSHCWLVAVERVLRDKGIDFHTVECDVIQQ